MQSDAPLKDRVSSPQEPVVRLGRMESTKIIESSGLAVCSTRSDAIWTQNDSGNSNEVFLVSTKGELLASLLVSGARNQDWEAMCSASINGQNYLVIGDVGDNLEKRTSSFLYIIPEPAMKGDRPASRKVNPITVEFQYPDGAHNCEAIAYDGLSNKLWLIEKRYVDDKRKTKPGVFSLTLPLVDTKKPIVATRIGDFPIRNVTGMAFSPDGKRLIIRNYLNAHLYSRNANQSWQETFGSKRPRPVVLPIQIQGEAICFTADSNSVIVTSEMKRQPIWQINLRPKHKTANSQDR